MIIILPQVKIEAADLLLVKAVADNSEASHSKAEARDLSTINIDFRTTGFREVHTRAAIINTVATTNPISRKINHAFPLVRDCIEQLGRKKCHYLSTVHLRDAFHTLRLALSSQKYCSITPYDGSPPYHYLHMGMGMSVSPQIWQQFVELVFQDDLIKCKQNFDVIMDDTFIHSTAEEHMDDLKDLFKVLRKYSLKLSPHKCHFFKKEDSLHGIRISNSRR